MFKLKQWPNKWQARPCLWGHHTPHLYGLNSICLSSAQLIALLRSFIVSPHCQAESRFCMICKFLNNTPVTKNSYQPFLFTDCHWANLSLLYHMGIYHGDLVSWGPAKTLGRIITSPSAVHLVTTSYNSLIILYKCMLRLLVIPRSVISTKQN